jgi:uncharacterized repeat protein (TIGR01451 family)
MTSKRIDWRRTRRGTSRRQDWPLAAPEILEARTLLAGTVPSGTYVEDFALNSDPTQPGWDVGGAFREQITGNAGIQVITDPNRIEGDNWSLGADTSGSTDFELMLRPTAFYEVTFPNLAPGVHVAGVSLDVESPLCEVGITGVNSPTSILTVVQGGGTQHIFLGEEHYLPSGLELGPITSIGVAELPTGKLSDYADVEKLTILVVPDIPNSPPIAGDDVGVVAPGQSVDIDVLANDSDPNGDSIHVSAVGNPAHGSVQISSSGAITYTADTSYHGIDSFPYTVSDMHGATATATVTVHVNTPPTAPDQEFHVPHGTTGSFSVAAPGLLAGASDADSDPLTVTVTDGALGHVAVDAATGQFTYTPTSGGLVPFDDFTYTVSDGQATATGTVDLDPDNQPPPAATNLTEEVGHGVFGPLTFAAPGLFAVNPRTDMEGDTLRPFLLTDPFFTQPAFGSVTLNDDGSFTYTPSVPTRPDQDDSFSYALFDGYAAGPPATVHLHVPNNPPVVRQPVQTIGFSHGYATQPAAIGNVNDYATDPDGDPLHFLSAVIIGGGSLTSDAQGNLTFAPAPGQTVFTQEALQTMETTLSLEVTDGYAASPPVQIIVEYTNTPPVAHDQQFDVPVDQNATNGITDEIPLQLDNGYGRQPPYLDADGDTVHAILVSGPAHGTINFDDGDVFYHESRPYLTDSFSYKLSDGFVESNVATVTLVPQRAAPTLVDDELVTDRATQELTRDILSNDYFPDLTPVAGIGTAILSSLLIQAPSETFSLVGRSGQKLQPGDPLDFRNGGVTISSPVPQPSYQFFYKVRYPLNDDPNSPTAVTSRTAEVDIQVSDQPQADNDGIPDDVENGAPNHGDGNNDGIPDSQQDNVASLPDATDGGYVTLASDRGTELANVKDFSNAAADVPPGFEFPLGFFQFRLIGPFFATVNGVKQHVTSASVDLYSPVDLPGPPNFLYYRHGPTPSDSSDHWYDFTYDSQTQTGAEWISPRLVRLHFIDGGRGDDDLQPNDIIVDAGGPAIPAPDLALSQAAAPAAPRVGQDLTFTLTVTNTASIAAPGVVVTDPLPSGAAFVSTTASQGSSTFDGSTLRFTVGTLDPGASATLLVVVRPAVAGPLVNTTRVSGDLPDPVASNDVATATATVVAAENPLPPLVTVVSLQPTMVRVALGTGKRAKTNTETGLLLKFSGALAGTGNVAAYQLLTGKVRKGVTTFHASVPLTVLNSTPTSVTLLPKGKLNLSLPEQLRVVAADLTDAFGRPLEGGQSFVATFGKKVVTSAAVDGLSRIGILSAPAVDAVLARGLIRSLRHGVEHTP